MPAAQEQWFKPYGLLFYPVSLAGWIITLGAIIFCVHIFLGVDGASDSVSDTLYGIVPFVLPTFLLVAWLADRTGARR
jgi:hypothetical protein